MSVAAGTYVENITLKDGVTVLGDGADACTIDGSSSGSVVTYTAGGLATLNGFTITNGYASDGGGIYVDNGSRLLIYNCTMTENAADQGGGVFATNTSIVNINTCTIIHNRAGDGGAVYNKYSSYTIFQYSTVSGNSPTQIIGFSESHDYGGNTFGDATWYVDDDGPANYTGIQDAIDASADGETVTVMPGTYVENLDMDGKAIILTGSDPNDSAVVATTIIDGGANGSVITCDSDEGTDTVISGFVITNGNATDGGGMYNKSSSPTVSNCTFSGNTADTSGGGMCNTSSSPTVSNCNFTSNTANDGGGMYNERSASTISNCTFCSNTAGNSGGGMYIYNVDTPYLESFFPTIVNCNMIGNFAGNNGGGLYFTNSSGSTMENNLICSNIPEAIYGSYTDDGSNYISDSCRPEESIDGDMDGDGDVDMVDFAAFAENWLVGVE